MSLTVDLGRLTANICQAIGPGWRVGLWVRGCPFRCPGCCSAEWQRPGPAEQAVSVAEVIDQIRQATRKYDLEGLTLSGGEPFGQAEALAEIAAAAHQLGLSVQCWTGYQLEELQVPNAPPGTAALLEQLDVLIDGRFERGSPTAPMRGSANQRLHFLTDRYGPADYTGNPVELRQDPNGGLTSYGIMPTEVLDAVMMLFGLEESQDDSPS